MKTELSINQPSDARAATGQRHCLFRGGSCWYAIPAESILHIGVSRSWTHIPACPVWMLGLAHFRGEFIPVIDPTRFLTPHHDDAESGDKFLVIQGRGLWGLQIANVPTVEPLETLVATESRSDESQPAVLGTATSAGRIIRVLDPLAVYSRLEQSLEELWRRRLPKRSVHSNEADR